METAGTVLDVLGVLAAVLGLSLFAEVRPLRGLDPSVRLVSCFCIAVYVCVLYASESVSIN